MRAIDFKMDEQMVRRRVKQFAATNEFEPAGFSGVRLRVQFFKRSRKVRVLQAIVPGGAQSLLTQVWGEPIRPAHTNLACWLNPQAGLQATVQPEDDTALFHAYRPAASLLGTDRQLGFVTTPLLGMEIADIQSAYPDYLLDSIPATDTRAVLMLPPTECSREPTFVDLRLARGRVDRIHLKLPYLGDPQRKETLLGMIRTKYGDPVAQRDAVVTYRLNGPKVLVADDPQSGVLSLFISQDLQN